MCSNTIECKQDTNGIRLDTILRENDTTVLREKLKTTPHPLLLTACMAACSVPTPVPRRPGGGRALTAPSVRPRSGLTVRPRVAGTPPPPGAPGGYRANHIAWSARARRETSRASENASAAWPMPGRKSKQAYPRVEEQSGVHGPRSLGVVREISRLVPPISCQCNTLRGV